MIEVVDHLFIKLNGETLCTVQPVLTEDTEWPSGKPDVAATKTRAEHIAEALRHYQASQEGERVP